MARERGWAECLASALAATSNSVSVPRITAIPARLSCPEVSVPVLSSATTLTSAKFSIGAPPRKRMPRRAPAAMAERMPDGTDNTNAQGDATTRSVIAR